MHEFLHIWALNGDVTLNLNTSGMWISSTALASWVPPIPSLVPLLLLTDLATVVRLRGKEEAGAKTNSVKSSVAASMTVSDLSESPTAPVAPEKKKHMQPLCKEGGLFFNGTCKQKCDECECVITLDVIMLLNINATYQGPWTFSRMPCIVQNETAFLKH